MKKGLATLMAVSMAICGLTGCGNSGSGSNDTGSSASASIESSVESSVVQSTESQASEETAVTEPSVEEGRPEEDVGEGGEGAESSTDEPAPEKTIPDSGIIVCALWNFAQGQDYVVFSLDPNTGRYDEIQHFFPQQEDFQYYFEWPPVTYHYNLQDRFSNDFSKLAETYVDYKTKTTRAGWINADGSFFDVAEALGMGAENEFVAQPNYYSIGFTEEGNYFVFAELTGHKGPVEESDLERDGKFYYVSLDNLSEIYEGNPLKEEATRGYEVFKLTQWINDEEYLSDYRNNNGVICNATNGIITEYVPGEARTNSSAIAGPDGSIAFVSKPKNSREDVGIYRTQRDGSGLERILTCDELFGYGGRRKESFISMYLLSWK